MSQSKNLAAFLPAAASPLTIGERPIPTPGPGEILVRNYALAVNPVDWKRRDWGFAIPSYPTILGSGELHLPKLSSRVYYSAFL